MYIITTHILLYINGLIDFLLVAVLGSAGLCRKIYLTVCDVDLVTSPTVVVEIQKHRQLVSWVVGLRGVPSTSSNCYRDGHGYYYSDIDLNGLSS